MLSTSELDLVNFFIFNPKFGQREGEEEKKILFYYPQDTLKDDQLKSAGLCEALIKFTESFKPDKPCHSFRTSKTKQFLYEAESSFWFVMTVGVSVNSDEKSQEDNGHLIQENVFEAVLKKSYKTYKILHGNFNSKLSSPIRDSNLENLIKTLNSFYTNYLSELKLTKCDILDVFQGISYLPLGKEPFLNVQSCINAIETEFKSIKYSAILYNDQLIWSGINSDDMQIIYQHLIFSFLPSYLDIQEVTIPKYSTSPFSRHGNFMIKYSNHEDIISELKRIPKVHLTNNGDSLEIFHLVVYQVLNATLCLFIDERELLTIELFKSLDSYIGPCLTKLVAEITDYCKKYKSLSNANEKGPKVLYFNKLNLARKTTMHVQNRKNISTTVPSDILRMISDLSAEKSDAMDVCGEVICLTLNDCWLVGRYSNFREFYVVFTQKKGNLVDIADEVKKLSDSQLKGIFFPE